MLPETVTDAVIGVALAGFLLFTGTASWYFPTVFLRLFDRHDVSPWPQLLFTPAAYVGAYVLVLTLGLGLYAVHGVVALCIGAAVVCRHRRSTATADALWPSLVVGRSLVALGAGLALFSVVRTLGAG